VRNASLADCSLIGAGNGLAISMPGAPPNDANRLLAVGPAFLTTMQIPILAGRDIEERDQSGSQPVAVINERFAKVNFGGQDPLGRHLILWQDKRPARDMEIVGVSKNARYGGLKQDIPPIVYIPYDQGYPQPNEIVYALRSAGDPLSYVNSVREIVRHADGRVPVSDVRTQKAEIEDDMHPGDHAGRSVLRLRAARADYRLRRSLRHDVLCRRPPHGVRSGFGWHSGHSVAPSFGWCYVRSWCWRQWGSRLVCQRH
jgi:macrolide transport system ATP-binding/permease protein